MVLGGAVLCPWWWWPHKDYAPCALNRFEYALVWNDTDDEGSRIEKLNVRRYREAIIGYFILRRLSGKETQERGTEWPLSSASSSESLSPCPFMATN